VIYLAGRNAGLFAFGIEARWKKAAGAAAIDLDDQFT
jgi:hypothetical protein